MKVKKIILQDTVDPAFSDLILWEEPIELSVIEKTIEKVKKENEDCYNFDDIYYALQDVQPCKAIDLYNAEIIKY